MTSQSIPATVGRSDRAAVGMFCLLLATYVINAMDRQLFPILASDVRGALSLSVAQVGLAATIFTLGMAVSGAPTSYLLGRMRRKDVAMLGLALFSLATLLTAYAYDLPTLLVCRFVSGIGEGLQFGAILAIGATYFVRHRALAVSSLNFTFGIGAIIGPNLGAALLETGDWQMPFVVFGLAGLPVLLLTAVGARTWFTEVASPVQDTVPDLAPIREKIPPLAVVLTIATILTGLTVYGYLGLYPTYLREQLNFTPSQSAVCISAYGLGMLLSLFGGWIGDKADFKTTLFWTFLASAILGSLLFSNILVSVYWHILGSFLFGVAISGFGVANLSAGIVKALGPHRTAQATGLFISAFYGSAAFAGYLLGALKGAIGWAPAAILQIGGSAALAALLCLAAKGLARSPEGARL